MSALLRALMAVALLILAPTALAAPRQLPAPADGGGSGGGGGDAAAFEFCRDGSKPGFPEGAGYREFDFTCWTYPWSRFYGGVDADGVSDFDTPTTTGGNSEWVSCTGDTTGNSDRHGLLTDYGPCLNDAHNVKSNAMADAMIAADWTRDNGKIYGPVTTGWAATVYQISGCGMQTDGSTANGCPVLRPPHHTHKQRSLQMTRGIQLVLQGQDPDGHEKPIISANVTSVNRETMVGAYVLVDTGNSGSPNDPNGDAVSIYLDNNFIGYQPTSAQCTKVSGTDFRCVASNTPNSRMGITHWAAATTVKTFGTGLDPSQLCLENTPSMCSLRRDIACTLDSQCDDGTTDYGPCIGWVDAMYDDVGETPVPGALVMVQQPLYTNFDETGPNLTAYNTLRLIREIEDPEVVCATTGRRVRFGSELVATWPFESQAISAGSTITHVDRGLIGEPGYVGGTWMPANWAGRDAPGTANDCTVTGVGTSCDRGSIFKYRLTRNATVKNAAVLHCSQQTNSCIDGGSWPSRFIRNVVAYATFGAWFDMADMQLFENHFYQNRATGTGINCFAGNCQAKRNTFIANQSGSSILGVGGRGRSTYVIEGNTYASNSAQLGHISISTGGYVTMKDDTCQAGIGAYLTVRPLDANRTFFSVDGLRSTGQGCIETNSASAKAAIVITPFNATTAELGKSVIKNLAIETNKDESCAVYLDTRDASFSDTFGRLTLEGIEISDPTGTATGLEGVCAFPFDSGGANPDDAGDDLTGAVFTLPFPPVMKNITVNGIARPESPVPYVDASDNASDARYDCDNQQAGTITCINDDVSVGSCTDAGADGILDGGGSAKSCCVCDGAGDHVAFP